MNLNMLMNKKMLLQNVTKNTDWEGYLNNLDAYMKSLGFKKHDQKHKGESFAYWKDYGKKYQIGLLVYDWTGGFVSVDGRKVSIGFECMLLNFNWKCDLSVLKYMELEEFEVMAENFYNAVKNEPLLYNSERQLLTDFAVYMAKNMKQGDTPAWLVEQFINDYEKNDSSF